MQQPLRRLLVAGRAALHSAAKWDHRPLPWYHSHITANGSGLERNLFVQLMSEAVANAEFQQSRPLRRRHQGATFQISAMTPHPVTRLPRALRRLALPALLLLALRLEVLPVLLVPELRARKTETVAACSVVCSWHL